MTKLAFDYENLKNKIYSSLNKTEDKLSSAINTASSLNVPSGFRYSGDLSSLSSFLVDKKKMVSEIKLSIDKSYKDYDAIETELSVSLSQIRTSNLKDRVSIINK